MRPWEREGNACIYWQARRDHVVWLRRGGMPFRQIANLLGVCTERVRQIISTAEIDRLADAEWRRARQEHVVWLHLNGARTVHIAQQTGFTESHINNIIRKAGVR